MNDPYKILGVPRTASAKEIRTAYKNLAKVMHPDKHPHATDSERAAYEQQFKDIEAAYRILSDPAKRAYYDQTGLDGLPTVDGLARDKLMQLFDSIVAGAIACKDPTAHAPVFLDLVRDELTEARQTARDAVQMHTDLAAKLNKLKRKVVAKGDNLFVEVVEKRLAAAQRALLLLDTELRAVDAALELLDAYDVDISTVYSDHKNLSLAV